MPPDDPYTADIHDAADVAAARQVLMRWIEHTGSTDDGARMAEKITARAVELGLEPPDGKRPEL